MLAKGLNLIVKTALVSAVLLACNSDPRDWSRTRPAGGSGILQKEAFVKLMTDVYLAEASYKSLVHTNPAELEKLEGNYAVILSAHNITQEEFEASHTWWWEHPAAMKGVLQEVTENIISVEKALNGHADSK